MKSFWNFLKKNKLYAGINLAGLTVSMAFVLLLAVYVQRQLSTDSFQKNADRIFVIANEENVNMAYWLDKHLKNQFPEIEKGCCVASMDEATDFVIDGETVYGSTMTADSTFFEIFSYELAAGDKADWRVSEDRCMVSEAFARAHFGDRNPVGCILTAKTYGVSLTVCGVFKDFGNSVLHAPDVLCRGELLKKTNPANNEHMSNAGVGICFVMTRPEADLNAKHDALLDWLKANFWLYDRYAREVRIIPLRDLYFLQNGADDMTDTLHFGKRNLVGLLLAMCLLLLAFAMLNYINLTTALTGFRAKEMATRRLVGAGQRSIFFKMIGESTLLCGVAMILALLLAEAIAPAASALLQYPISVFAAISPVNILLMLGFIGMLGMLAGLVPALIIRKARPIDIVRGTLRRKTKTVYSKVIIVVQNVVAIGMLVASLTMWAQIRHMTRADLGYETQDILVVNNVFGRTGKLQPLLDKWRSEPFVETVGMGNGIPLTGTNNWTVKMVNDDWVSFQMIQGDQAYFDILGLRLKQDNHNPGQYFLNEYAFKAIGIGEEETEFHTQYESRPTIEIAGIYYDFRFWSILDRQSAALIRNNGEHNPENDYPWNLVVKVRGHHGEALARLKADAAEVFPDRIFRAEYIEDSIRNRFAEESRILRIVFIFTLLSGLISALGLFAMSSYYMQQEVRSVAVKKVFGAEYAVLRRQLVLSFMKLTGIAFLIAVPVSGWLMERWLSGYSYRIALQGWIFAAAGAAAALISVVSVRYQSARTARMNPAEVLKKE